MRRRFLKQQENIILKSTNSSIDGSPMGVLTAMPVASSALQVLNWKAFVLWRDGTKIENSRCWEQSRI